jgi:hypothetical protein
MSPSSEVMIERVKYELRLFHIQGLQIRIVTNDVTLSKIKSIPSINL